MKILTLTFTLLTATVQAQSLDKFMSAIHQVETSSVQVGDHGKAIGPFQIWHSYWSDAKEFDPTLGGSYRDCYRYDYAKRVVEAYLKRHAPTLMAKRDYYTMARIHNGGPSGYKKASTNDYAQRVVNLMKYERQTH